MTKEEIIKNAQTTKYVAMTPYISMGPETRFKVNMFSTASASEEQLLNSIRTLDAVKFIESVEIQHLKECEQRGEANLWTTYIIEISYFVDERLRTQKTFRSEIDVLPDGTTRVIQRPKEEDILSSVHCITINYSSKGNSKRKTFVVDLDDLAVALEQHGYESNLCSDGINKFQANRLFVSSAMEESMPIMATIDYGLNCDPIDPKEKTIG